MGTLKFTDGVEFNTDGPFRVERRHDGYYVVGHGHLIAVDGEEEGQKLVDKLTEGRCPTVVK